MGPRLMGLLGKQTNNNKTNSLPIEFQAILIIHLYFLIPTYLTAYRHSPAGQRTSRSSKDLKPFLRPNVHVCSYV